MGKYRKLSHVVYQCNYHIVWVPKYRYRILKGAVKELVEKEKEEEQSRQDFLF